MMQKSCLNLQNQVFGIPAGDQQCLTKKQCLKLSQKDNKTCIQQFFCHCKLLFRPQNVNWDSITAATNAMLYVIFFMHDKYAWKHLLVGTKKRLTHEKHLTASRSRTEEHATCRQQRYKMCHCCLGGNGQRVLWEL